MDVLAVSEAYSKWVKERNVLLESRAMSKH